jgi:hypothetical protein
MFLLAAGLAERLAIPQLVLELFVVHRDVAGGVAEVGVAGEKAFVALLHDVELGVEQLGKMFVAVDVPVLLP